MTGIYIITNIQNNKKYVGSALNMQKRWERHLNLLRKTKHHSEYLQNAWNKYGSGNFRFEIFESGIAPEDLLSWEQAVFDYLQPEYNICKFAGSSYGTKQSRETILKRTSKTAGLIWNAESRLKLSKARTGKSISKKLTKEKVEGIKYLLTLGKWTHRQIGNMYDVTKMTVWAISKGKIWKN